MNRTVTFAAGALALGVFAGGASAQTAVTSAPTGKIGVIEVQKVVQESAVGKESLARVQKVQQAKQDDLAKRQKELRDMEQKIQDQGKALSEDAAYTARRPELLYYLGRSYYAASQFTKAVDALERFVRSQTVLGRDILPAPM